ncbi:hypothetical protein N7448_005118 [Penicillium atrosanguineum]|uniref:Uncharacterized protein n=1 Tax=Penicillium atrosanguineum TaxID=1132637 RepID=A0A9W9PQH4_9EURO|nr:Succinate dehydrogenase assembly factor 3 [Penicillium atrosanguineum]KAJ5125804.1 hypothetical protein N7526_007981 [Penicillium atrosanguineum]KAJ5136564.1 hypothetical protein N7448_005118 [Penicillium atrosanguineum]KAJ5292895.1 Succinate dehydrogenase assembly factor 3 [Penicillium atrosanguineum]KAJ5303068.1 hypothetical protein N7476_009867 [Penicillium atrosanguineum]
MVFLALAVEFCVILRDSEVKLNTRGVGGAGLNTIELSGVLKEIPRDGEIGLIIRSSESSTVAGQTAAPTKAGNSINPLAQKQKAVLRAIIR